MGIQIRVLPSDHSQKESRPGSLLFSHPSLWVIGLLSNHTGHTLHGRIRISDSGWRQLNRGPDAPIAKLIWRVGQLLAWFGHRGYHCPPLPASPGSFDGR